MVATDEGDEGIEEEEEGKEAPVADFLHVERGGRGEREDVLITCVKGWRY